MIERRGRQRLGEGRRTRRSVRAFGAGLREQAFDFEPRDIFVVPSWSSLELEVKAETVLFSFSDRPGRASPDIALPTDNGTLRLWILPDVRLDAALAWGLYAAWEAYVNFETPEADIRVDLQVISPIHINTTLIAIGRAI